MFNILDFEIHNDENERQYIWRVGQYVKQGKITWKELSPIINEKWRDSEDEYRDESAYRKPFQSAENYYEDVFSKMMDDEYAKEINLQKRELEKERKKIQTEKIEYNQWLREEARDELIVEKIVEAIKSTSCEYPMPSPVINTNPEKTGILCFGDEHFGTSFEIRGLFNEIINAYNPEIFESRMWDLFNQVVDIITKENLTNISIYSLGDFTDGILRVKQLFHLKYGVIEGSTIYGKFIVNWLNKLSEYVYIRFQMVNGNHSELRMLAQPKGTFTNENTGLIVKTFLETCLSDNPNFEFIQNPTGLIFENIYGSNFLGIHGEVRNMEKAIKDFSNTYKTQIDYLIGGHMHHERTEVVGIDREVINVPSIIGVDDYSISLSKTSNAGATFIVFEKDYGIRVKYPIKVNNLTR